MNTCKNCIHWRESSDEIKEPKHFVGRWGCCTKGVGSIIGISGEPLGRFDDCATDCFCEGRDEEFSGLGVTGPDFGCVHWGNRHLITSGNDYLEAMAAGSEQRDAIMRDELRKLAAKDPYSNLNDKMGSSVNGDAQANL